MSSRYAEFLACWDTDWRIIYRKQVEKLLKLIYKKRSQTAISNADILMFSFPKSLKEVEALFLLGSYMDMVDKSMRASHGELFIGSVRGQLVIINELTGRQQYF